MSEQTAVVQKQQPSQPRQHPAPFEIEFGYGDRWICSLKGRRRFRGKWSRFHLGGLEGSMGGMSQMPDIPGLRMRISFKDRKMTVRDPLESQPELLKKISSVCRSVMLGFNSEYKFVPANEEVLDPDRLKTLLIELRKMADTDDPGFEVVSGELPTMEQIEAMEGRELNDPAGDGFYRKAKYKDDVDRHELLLQAMHEKGITI